MEEFPYWERLHGYWRTLPNFNPHTVTSEPGQPLENEAMALFGVGPDSEWDRDNNSQGVKGDNSSLSPEELAELETDPSADQEDCEDQVAGHSEDEGQSDIMV